MFPSIKINYKNMINKFLNYKITSSQNPSIFIFTIPKSGTDFIETAISKLLPHYNKRFAKGAFYDLPLNYKMFKTKFIFHNQIFVSHTAPTIYNIQLLEYYNYPIIIHLRDPREVIISLVHFFNSFHEKNNEEALLLWTPFYSSEIFLKSFEKQIDFAIANYLPQIVKWISIWIEVSSNSTIPILFTTYNDLIKDTHSFLLEVLKYFKIEYKNPKFSSIKFDKGKHFRKGKINEWETLFTESQKKRSLELIPEDLLTRFE